MRNMTEWGWAALAAMALATPAEGAAQSVDGFVFYVHNDFPVAVATVRLVTPEGAVVTSATTSYDGRFHLDAPKAGEYHIHVEHLTAFDMVDGPLLLDSARTAFVTFQVVALPIALDAITVEVEGRSLPLARNGFYDRRISTLGVFYGPDELERVRPLRVSDLVRRIPGMTFVANNGMAGASGYPMMNYALRNLGVCYPRVVVDGAVLEQGGLNAPFTPDFDRLVATQDLAAVEVYRSPAEVPPQYGGGTACGVIVMWTKVGRGRG